MTTTPSEPTLLALPDEILVQILCKLPLQSILVCQSVCYKLNSIVTASTEIRYRIALEVAGLEDNEAYCPLSPAEKLDKLLQSQKAWRHVAPEFTKKIIVDHTPSEIYDLSGGAYLLGGDPRLDLKYVVLPEKQDDEPRWKTIGVNELILDVGLCVDEHDLVAVVTTRTPLSAHPPLYDIGVHFMQFSTGQPYPLVKHPRMSAYKSKYGSPMVGIEIVGENLVLVLSQSLNPFQDASQPEDRVFVYEWRTGMLKMSWVAPYRSYYGVIFLQESLLLLPNARRGTLEIWDLPRTPIAPSPSAPLCVLELPRLAPGRSFGPLSCRAEPSPVGETSQMKLSPDNPVHEKRRRRAFKTRSEDAIIIFNIRIQPLQVGPHPVAALGFSHTYTFFLHRRSLLRLVHDRKGQHQTLPSPFYPTLTPLEIDIDFPSSSALFPAPVAWEEWGLKLTRWIEAGDVPTRWITTTSGQRAVFISSHARNTMGAGSPIVVMDFNQWNVKKVKLAYEAKRRRKAQKAARRREREEARVRRKFERCREWLKNVDDSQGLVNSQEPVEESNASDGYDPLARYRELADAYQITLYPLNWPLLEESNAAQVRMFLEANKVLARQLESLKTSNEPEGHHDDNKNGGDLHAAAYSDSDEPPSDTDEADSSMDSDNPKPIWGLGSAQAVDRSGVCFDSPVHSELPCLGYKSKGQFHYDGVLMDEERILGITTDRADRVKNIEVQYFG